MSKPKGNHRITLPRGGPYHVAKNRNGVEAWAYNENKQSIDLVVRNPNTLTTIVRVRKSVLRNLAALK